MSHEYYTSACTRVLHKCTRTHVWNIYIGVELCYSVTRLLVRYNVLGLYMLHNVTCLHAAVCTVLKPSYTVLHWTAQNEGVVFTRQTGVFTCTS